MKSLADLIIGFYKSLRPPILPRGVEALFPQGQDQVINVVEHFFHKYYQDNKARQLILGINPGRFGAGVTGINFTAPRQLKECCGIDHPFGDKTELSAEFIYEMIAAYGGERSFYGDFFLTSVCPLGFVKNGVNLNYYDDRAVESAVKPFIISCIQAQLSMGFERKRCVCIGGDKNFKYLSTLNSEHNFFEKIISLPHPRFIMQYRRKRKQEYIDEYLSALRPIS